MASRANGLSATHFRLLDDLLRTKKLSATAANFGISVSSASRMLMQLREVFGEPLFTTTASGLQPTAAMLRMTPRLDAYLKAFDDLLAPAVFAPENISGTFYIASCGLVMPNILLRVFEQMQLRAAASHHARAPHAAPLGRPQGRPDRHRPHNRLRHSGFLPQDAPLPLARRRSDAARPPAH